MLGNRVHASTRYESIWVKSESLYHGHDLYQRVIISAQCDRLRVCVVSISVTFLVFQSSYSLLVINYFSSCWKWNSPELIVLCFNNLLSDSNFGLLLLSEASTRLTSKDPGKFRFICSLLLAFCCSSCFCEWTSKKDKLSECVGIDESKGRDGDACINSAINSCVTGLCLRMGWMQICDSGADLWLEQGILGKYWGNESD